MKVLNNYLSGVFLSLVFVSICAAFQSQNPGRSQSSVCQHATSSSESPAAMSRSQWLQTAAGGAFAAAAAMTTAPEMAFAKDDAALKGTKMDPTFEACLSQCIYECTKPKGSEQKSRKECLPECKTQCAKTKAQLMTGQPIQQN